MNFDQSYNRHEFVSFLRQDFLPEDDFIQEETPVAFPIQTQYCYEVTRLGSSKSLDLDVYEIRHHSKSDARVGMSKEAFRLLYAEGKQCALVIFVPEDSTDNYRFSFIEMTLHQDEDSSRVKKTYSNPRRYSYYLGKGIACYTPNKYLNAAGRVTSIEDLRNRFSVEVLTKSFYQELSDWYAWVVKIIRFPNKLNDPADDDKFNAESTIRLVTRLIFVWFLKQKNLIPNEFFDRDYIKDNLLEDFNPEYNPSLFYNAGESKYYKAILQNLFFAMLNSPITKEGETELSERHFRKNRGDYDNNKLMRYESLFTDSQLFVNLANRTVPFLNGGLFDCLDDKDADNYIDGFSDRKEVQESLFVPDYIFFAKEVIVDLSHWYEDKKKKKVKVSGILNILKRYNFTIEENTPFDQEVSLDPELLGKVFENLLASYNPETQTTARKQTGSFYTPREIVQYMVDESLVAHLKRTVGEDLEPEYRKLVAYTDEESNLTDEQKHQIMEAIYNCKVLDPACGSGAFPVGMLQQMVHILNRIDPTNDNWKKMLIDNAVKESRNAFQADTDEERNARLKDIEDSFNESLNNPDYARKLYLIENCIYGVDIQSIAIQISKLRFFISLVVDQLTNNDPIKNFGIRPLPNLEAKFVAANTLIGLNKKDATLFDTDAICAKKEELKIAKHKIFGAKTVKTKRKYRQIVNDLRLEIANMLEECGAVGNEEAQHLASWDMFDQNTSSQFFDPEWMFDVRDGFNIVIGNPPFVFTRDVEFSNDFKRYVEEEYFSRIEKDTKKSKAKQSGKINLFAIFVIKGILLNSYNGILFYILPNNILRTTTYDIIRQYIIDNTSIEQIVDLGSGIFENVTASTILIQLSSLHKEDNIVSVITKVDDLERRRFGLSKIKQIQFRNNISYAFNIYSDEVSNMISNKIRNCGRYLGSFCVDIIEGIVAHKHLIADHCKDGYEPLLEGKCVKRYYNLPANKFILWDKKLIHRSRPDYLWQLNEKIIIQRISGGEKPIIASIDKSRFKTFASINNLVLKENYEHLYPVIVAFLNSNVVNWYYANNFSNKSELTVNISKTYLEMIPLPKVDKVAEDALCSLVNKIIYFKSNDVLDTSSLENEINFIIYKLYNLTFDEVLIIDPQTPITREEYEQNN